MVGNQFNTIASWLCQLWGIPDLALFSYHSSKLIIEQRCFCLIPYSLKNFFTKSRIFLSTGYTNWEPVQPVGNRFNQFCTIAGCLYQPWGTPDLALFGSHSSGFGIEHRYFFLFYSFRNFLRKFGNFSQLVGPIGNRFNWFSTTARWLCQLWGTPNLALFGSNSVGLGIEHHYFCVIIYSFRNFLTKFGNYY